MIDAMETLLEHWGEQRRCKGLGGGAASPLAGMMEWKGAPPRGAVGAVMLLGGAGLDHAASQVEAALAELERIGQAADAEAGGRTVRRSAQSALVELAHARYRRQLDLAEQLKAAGCEKSALYERLHDLHVWLQAAIKRRLKGRAA